MVKLSIIIPYFETYELTKRLLEELIRQTTDEVEVLVYDDGCNEIKLNMFDGFNRILVKHQKNVGVAKTRNRGIKEAKGKYIAFIDCDDMITTDYIDILLEAIDKYNTDIINFNWLELTKNKVWIRPDNPAPWKAIYKKETMLKFREDRHYGEEDVDFQEEINNRIASNTYSIAYLDRVLYIYNDDREGSLFWKKTHKGGIKMIKCEAIIDFDLKDFGELKNIIRKRKEKEDKKYDGKLYDGDIFECSKEMADYLGGNNKINRSVIEVIEIIPEKIKEDTKVAREDEEVEKSFEKKSNKKKKNKK